MPEKTNRRKFLKTGSRYLLLASLAGMSGYLLFRDEGDTVCDFSFGCGKCKRLSKCELSQAKDFNSKNPSKHSKGE